MKRVNIVQCSKNWWNEECQLNLVNYKSSKSLSGWRTFKNMVKQTKHTSFNDKIQEITTSNWNPWNLMNWVQKWKLLTIETISFNSRPYIELDNLWQALHFSFNFAHNYHINIEILDEIPSKLVVEWKHFLKEEFRNAISKCNNSSVPGSNKISWKILKQVINIKEYLVSIINIANACINLGYWPSHFKLSTLIIIPKPNKLLYDLFKSIHPIILLNTLSKLVENKLSVKECSSTLSPTISFILISLTDLSNDLPLMWACFSLILFNLARLRVFLQAY